MKPRFICILFTMICSALGWAQNLIPNPSFENMTPCDFIQPELSCLQNWSDYLGLDPTNTPDLGYEGAVFFPPSTIDAYDGNQYLNMECSTGNPEYIQIDMTQTMTAGTSYCVSFYASMTQESTEVAPSLGAYFTDAPILDSPFELGIEASVQGPVDFDPTSWTLVSGTYVAQGGENIMVLAGFENTGTMPFPYMYIDMVSVVPMPVISMLNADLCDGPVVLDVFTAGATYVWSNGATSSSIEVNEPGVFSVIRTIGTCSQESTAEVLDCETDITDPEDTVPNDTIIDPADPIDSLNGIENTLTEDEFNFYIPNAFTPDGDGINDVFGVIGPVTDTYALQIFNRWGQMVYQSTNIEDRWTGNHLGGAYYFPDGIYIYHVKAIEGKLVYEDRGHVLIMR